MKQIYYVTIWRKCITLTILVWDLVVATVDNVGTCGKIAIEGGRIIVDTIIMVD